MATVQPKDVVPVGSRVSWGAIFAGAATGLAIYLLLGTLGVALGLTAEGRTNVTDEVLGIGAAIYLVVTLLVALFAGGWVASQCTVGENKMEAVIYGIIVWAVAFAAILWMTVGGVRIGFNAVIGMANTPVAHSVFNRMSDRELEAAGLTPNEVARLRARAQSFPEQVREFASDPRTRDAAWWMFGGIVISMAASIAGSLLGSGPDFVLARWGRRSRIITTMPAGSQPAPR